MCTAVLIGCTEKNQKNPPFTYWLKPRNPPSPRTWAHIRGRYWSAKMDDISLWLWAPVCHPLLPQTPGEVYLNSCSRLLSKHFSSIPQFNRRFLVSEPTTFRRIALQTHLTLLWCGLFWSYHPHLPRWKRWSQWVLDLPSLWVEEELPSLRRQSPVLVMVWFGYEFWNTCDLTEGF